MISYSLHRARVPQTCQWCGDTVPVGGEYWRAHAPKTVKGCRLICVMCHVLFDCPTCGWTRPADGEQVFTMPVPSNEGAGV
jgi:hypothetical protein